MKCRYCGAESQGKFCPQCGAEMQRPAREKKQKPSGGYKKINMNVPYGTAESRKEKAKPEKKKLPLYKNPFLWLGIIIALTVFFRFYDISSEHYTPVFGEDDIIDMSSANQDIEVPDFTGFTKEEISRWAAENRIFISYTTEFSDTVPWGEISGQSISPGEMLFPNDSIIITISKGEAEASR